MTGFASLCLGHFWVVNLMVGAVLFLWAAPYDSSLCLGTSACGSLCWIAVPLLEATWVFQGLRGPWAALHTSRSNPSAPSLDSSCSGQCSCILKKDATKLKLCHQAPLYSWQHFPQPREGGSSLSSSMGVGLKWAASWWPSLAFSASTSADIGGWF